MKSFGFNNPLFPGEENMNESRICQWCWERHTLEPDGICLVCKTIAKSRVEMFDRLFATLNTPHHHDDTMEPSNRAAGHRENV